MIDLHPKQILGNLTVTRHRDMKRLKTSPASLDFEADLNAPQAPEEPSRVQSPFELAGVDALFLALQNPRDKNKEEVNRGFSLLDMLQSLQRSIVEGQISNSTLKELAHLSKSTPDIDLDPKLRSILQEIEVRSQVELAKLERK